MQVAKPFVLITVRKRVKENNVYLKDKRKYDNYLTAFESGKT